MNKEITKHIDYIIDRVGKSKDTDTTLDPITWLKGKSYSNATPISDIMSEYAEYCNKANNKKVL